MLPHSTTQEKNSIKDSIILPSKSPHTTSTLVSMSATQRKTSSALDNVSASKSTSKAKGKPENRLINSGHAISSKCRALILAKEVKDEQEYKAVCTFRPAIYSSNAQSKYLDNGMREMMEDENVEYRFRPEIGAKSETYAKKYTSLNKDIVKRLTRKQTPKEDKNAVVSTARVDFEEFLQRQEMHDISKRQRLDCLAVVTERHSPRINIRSQKLAAKKGNPRERIFKPKKEAVLNETTNWFKPKINPNSISILEAISRIKTSRKPTSVQVDKPSTKQISKSNSKNKIPSRLQLNDLDSLITRINRNTTNKAIKGEQQKIRREIEEESECTHKPRLNPFPQYLKSQSNLNRTLCEKKEYKYGQRKE
eukprot:TRINITY_DN5486_c0_g1_i2.p1 TRINITY_DN5486_c0_g1~~TRINITY_DN5486_c0_g1_i2.p1  ORF type:complete len:417 (-),score=95.21 TRINITY_DN5486_c0_g1_i2:97-1191(-)